jgi:hypothetical protein
MLAALALAGCSAAPRPGGTDRASPGRETVITEAEIAALSVRTAWDVVRLRAPRIAFHFDESGNPINVRIQAPATANADETPLVIVDGAQMLDLGALRQLPASEVRLIRILTAEAAAPLYGLRAVGGAIIVQTKGQ